MSTLYLWGKPILQHPPGPSTPNPLTIPLANTVADISCGADSCLVLAEDGVYALGDNTQGQLGLGSLRNTGLTAIRIELAIPQKVVGISCGWYHSLLLDNESNVFSSGRGDNGELGRDKVRNSSTFGFVLSGADQISAGKDHSLAVCGPKVFGWGNSKQGQLGLFKRKHYYRPHELNIYSCRTVMAGNKFSIFVTEKGVFGSGLNDQSQLGLGHSDTVSTPKRLAINEEIVKLSGGSYCAAGTADGEWYLWGNGKLGHYRYPTKMTFLSGADTVSLGLSSGMFLREGRMWIWGSNNWGELGQQQIQSDYPVSSEEFAQLRLNGFQFGINFMAAFSNSDNFYRTRLRNRSNSPEAPFVWNRKSPKQRDLQKSEHFSQQGHRIFDRYYNISQNDQILQKQINRKLYNEEFSICDSSSGNNSSGSMEGTRHQTPKGWPDKKYVKLCNPTKTLQASRSQNQLEKEYSQLRQQLLFERHQKQRLQHEYLRRLNEFERNKLTARINQIEDSAMRPKPNHKGSQSSLWSSYRKQPENISFRPKAVEADSLEAMEGKLSSLKSLLQGMCQ